MDKDEIEKRIQNAEEIRLMRMTAGWKKLEGLLREQLDAYIADNAIYAIDWENYVEKRAKIKAIELLLTDMEDYERMGEEAKTDNCPEL